MSYVFSWATIFFATKALGGSFHAVFARLGFVSLHGTVVGVLISGAIAAIAIRFRFAELSETIASKRSKFFLSAYLVLTSAAIVVRIHHVRHSPLDIKAADNIPTLLAGLKDVTHGINPYHPHVLDDGRTVEHYFLPVLWMSYFPLYAVGLDVRYLNVLAHCIFYLLLFDIFIRLRPSGPLYEVLFLGAVGLHAFSKLAIAEVTAIQHAPFWISYSIFLWAVARDRFNVVKIGLPLLMLSRELAILLVLPYGIFLWRQNRSQFKTAAIWSLGVGVALTLPFILLDAKGLFLGVMHYAGTVEVTPWEEMNKYYGVCGYLKKYGLLPLHFPIEISGTILGLFLATRRKRAFEAVALGIVGYLSFILVVSATFNYLFTEPLMLTYFMLLTGDPNEPK